eukprot:TRINITY_DN5311_c0_g1_i2.p1 TRINITY_DN5311_c0_g1~~TRINITY_DN5311_c0_g1_i2.p1  ORF type:complete len:290 (+),score=57.62 TRINITY_DN5311_c0_g1_i2:247-1116(+)
MKKISPKTAKIFKNYSIPNHIMKPYYHDGTLPIPIDKIKPQIMNEEDIKYMRKSCKIAKTILEYAGSLVKPGITTNEIDRFTFEEIIKHNSYPSPLNYSGFPKSICTSVNNVLCHGIPNDEKLKEGDIISIDITIYSEDGYHGDCCDTFPVGEVDQKAKHLITTTQTALQKAIEICKSGKKISDIAKIISQIARENKYSVSPDFMGHGIGKNFHQLPYVPHDDKECEDGDLFMKEGMIFTVEPILMQHRNYCNILRDRWTAVSEDGGLCAQSENTILITNDGAEILTKI